MLQSCSQDAGSRRGSGNKIFKMEQLEWSLIKKSAPDLRIYQILRSPAPIEHNLWPC